MSEKSYDEMRYAQLRDTLSHLPMTWYPDLIRVIVEAALSKGAFHPMMGVSKFVQSVELDWKKRQP